MGVIYRVQSTSNITITSFRAGSQLQLLVENMGRINFGHNMTDPKV